MSELLRQARNARGWSSARLRHQLRQVAESRGLHLASDNGLRIMLSRWENGHSRPDAMYRMLLQEVFDLPAAALGLERSGSDAESIDLLPLVSHAARRVETPAAVLDYFANQLREHTQLDNIAGPSYIISTATSQLAQLEQLTERGNPTVARLTARYAEFVGWLLQDSGEPRRALECTSRAIDYATLAGDTELATYSSMRKSNILSGLGQHQLAAATARSALAVATSDFPELVAVCLRQQALAAAGLKDETGSRDTIDRALALCAPSATTELSPYCTTSYLQMEAAHCLLTLRRPAEAELACSTALADWPEALVRDRTLCQARHSVALLEIREIDRACHTAMEAVKGVRSAPSGRTIQLLRGVVTQLRPYGQCADVKALASSLAEVA